MPSVCLYFQMHQPLRLRRYTVFDSHQDYFDDEQNRQILRRVAHRSYLPVLELFNQLAERYQGNFRLALSCSGTALQQFERYEPEVIERLRDLTQTGCVEFLSETDRNSLACFISDREFREQVTIHSDRIEDTFNQRPTVFRNTGFIFNQEIAAQVDAMDQHRGILTTNVKPANADEFHSQAESPNSSAETTNYLSGVPDHPQLAVLTCNRSLSDDIAVRFSDPHWSEHPLTAGKYANWLEHCEGNIVNLYMDLEALGEQHTAETGIFEFIADLPRQCLDRGLNFMTPSDALDTYEIHNEGVNTDNNIHPEESDSSRLYQWLNNAMQTTAIKQLYALELPVKKSGDDVLMEDWRNLTSVDHISFMATQGLNASPPSTPSTHSSPYASPYDAYINFMNILDQLRFRINDIQPQDI